MAKTPQPKNTGKASAKLLTIDTGTPVPVSVDQVENEFIDLWREVAETAQAKGGVRAVTTAQVLNLVIHAQSSSAANDYIRDVDFITGRHPCRVITAVADAAEDGVPVQAWVSIHCQLPPSGGRQVCCEQVSVVAGGGSVRQIPAAIIPLLISDLPVFLWWPQGTPFDDYLFRNLVDSMNRLIIDSSTFENPEGTLASLPARLRSNWPHIAMTDMNWARLTRWRELVAQFFDGPVLLPYLDRIDRVIIDFSLSERGGPVNRAQALMMAGWLASRLGWEPADNVYDLARADGNKPASARLSLRSGKRFITIMLNAGEVKAETPGDICGIRLEAPGTDPRDKPEAVFEVAISDDEDCAWASVDIEGAEPTRRNLQLETPTRAELLDQELEIFSRDKVYEEALDMVSAFIKGTKKPREQEGPRRIPTGEPVSAGSHLHPRTRPGR